MSYQHILTETHGAVGLIRFSRLQAKNALCVVMVAELRHALDAFEEDDQIGAIVVTGGEQIFASGGDVKEMAEFSSYAEVYREDFSAKDWLRLSACRKPTIAAVAGPAFGGGCELAMMCDFILAGDNAKFGQLEITVGIIPGAGGTQRLPRFVGKSKAMEMCLAGRIMDAAEAERSGLVSRIVPAAGLIEEAIHTAAKIASLSRPTAMMVKECINTAYETPLAEGLRSERRMFYSTFALEDQREGMTAFIAKRTPIFRNR